MVLPFPQGEMCLSILDSVLYGLLVYDGDGVSFANRKAVSILGYEDQEAIVGRPLIDLIHPDDRAVIRDRIPNAATRHIVVGEERLLRKDGSSAPVDIEIFPMKPDGAGGTLMFLRDISMRKRAEESHWESEKKYWQLFNSMGDGAFISGTIRSSMPNRISEVNDGFCRMLGFSMEELVGRPVIDMVDSSSRDEAEGMFDRLLDEGELLLTLNLLRKDGRIFPAELSARVIPLWDYPVVMTVVRDLSDKVRASSRVRFAEKRYESLFDNLVDAMSLNEIMTDEEGKPWNYRLLEVNRAYEKLTGKEKKELVGKTALELFPGEDFLLFDLYHSVAASGESKRFVHSSIEKGTVWDMVVFSPEEGQFALLIRDVTEERRLERLIRQTEKLRSLGELTGGIANDFVAYFQAVSGYGETLREDSSDPSARIIGSRILDVSERALSLIRKLLAFSKKGDVDFCPVDVHDVLLKLQGLFSHGFEDGPKVKLYLKAPIGRVLGDEGQLYNAFMNLILNAKEADPEGDVVTVYTGFARLDEESCAELLGDPSPGDFIRISVEDHGSGIRRSDLSRIMEPFFSTKMNSIGMGLPEVFGIVRSHGGGFSMETEERKGTIVSMYLPLFKEEYCGSDLKRAESGLEDSGRKGEPKVPHMVYSLEESLAGHRPRESRLALEEMVDRGDLSQEDAEMIGVMIEEYRFEEALRFLNEECGE
ncbi:PAS domain S-box protein [Dethiosulfovibrio sp. F2B]|uniref:PAS domain-containing sensor histidine kinase n=1 Tax=Dethiosulfovibrio faecalis TaxID=2720018 RepID=UPI001F17CCCB|nr:PAS domain S-box protein [Dethiosulfovibrio faecalis]MCF4151336.1 PAS domain S-box protein [Dethiosulfovibrio faecalis]